MTTTPPLEWRPIETAPNEGERVLLYVPPYGAMCGFLTHINDGYGGRMYWQLSSCLDKSARPTHWMPLPPPPTTDEQE